MKTIEVNLIGDLRQTYAPKKGRLPQTITKDTATPEETRETLILIGVGGTAAIAFIIAILTFIGCFGFGIYLDGKTEETSNKITAKEAELAKATKKRQKLISDSKQMVYQKAAKNYVKSMGINIPEVLQEMRAKAPEEITLVNIKRSKASVLLKGEVTSTTEEPLKSISLFIINLNTMKPSNSYVNDAILASTVGKDGKLIFAIKANYNNIQKKAETETAKDSSKKKSKN